VGDKGSSLGHVGSSARRSLSQLPNRGLPDLLKVVIMVVVK
jgi:hypothetical protein